MAETDMTARRAYRLPPCPAWDVEGMERWLEDMAGRGFFLAKDGFFAGFAAFDCGAPRKVKYRLAGAQNPGGFFRDDMGAPDGEQLELSSRYDWEYLDRRGEFHIYRCLDPEARELNTDPEVEALALNAVKKRRRRAMVWLLYWPIYLLVMVRGGLVLATVAVKAWVMMLLMLLLLWGAAEAFLELGYLRRFQRALRGEAASPPRRSPAAYFAGKFAPVLLTVLLIAALLHTLGVTLDRSDRVALSRYEGTIPFATMADIAGGEVLDYAPSMTGLVADSNTVAERRDWLAPRILMYKEYADVTTTLRRLSGGLAVDWYECRSPGVARLLAKDIRRYAWSPFRKRYAPLELPELPVDYAAAWADMTHIATIVLQKGDRVLRATLSQWGPEEKLTPAEWALALAESMGG